MGGSWRSGGICRLPRRGASSTGCIGAEFKPCLLSALLRQQYEADCHHRLAQGVRSKEEPEESFLKSIPSDVERLEIIYPVSAQSNACSSDSVTCADLNHVALAQSSFDPRYVRRRMKLVLKQQHNRLRMRMVTSLATCRTYTCFSLDTRLALREGHCLACMGKTGQAVSTIRLMYDAAGGMGPTVRAANTPAADAHPQPAPLLRWLQGDSSHQGSEYPGSRSTEFLPSSS